MISSVVSNPDDVKKLIFDSGVYGTAPDVFVSQFVSKNSEDVYAFAGIDDEEDVHKITDKVLPAKWIQENTEKIIDAFYDWFEGKTDIPTFTIDVADQQASLVSEFVNVTKDKLEELPVCTEDMADQFDPFRAACVPEGFNIQDADELEKVIYEQLTSGEFFDDKQVTSDQFIKIDEKVTNSVRTGYKIITNLPKIVLGLIVFLSLSLFFILPGLSNKFFVLGVNWTISGSSLMFANLLANSKFEDFYTSKISGLSSEQKEILEKIVKSIIDVSTSSIWHDSRRYAVIIIVIGVVFIVGGLIMKFSKKRYYMRDDDTDNEPKKDAKKKDEIARVKYVAAKSSVKKAEFPGPQITKNSEQNPTDRVMKESKPESVAASVLKGPEMSTQIGSKEQVFERPVVKPVISQKIPKAKTEAMPEIETAGHDAMSEVEQMEERLNMKTEEVPSNEKNKKRVEENK
jgi:hypothetical protein